MSIVNFIFNATEEEIPKPLHEFTDNELAQFGTLRNSGPENSLLKGADPDGTRFKNKDYPWKYCQNWDECYKRLLNPDDPVRYMPGFLVRFHSIIMYAYIYFPANLLSIHSFSRKYSTKSRLGKVAEN